MPGLTHLNLAGNPLISGTDARCTNPHVAAADSGDTEDSSPCSEEKSAQHESNSDRVSDDMSVRRGLGLLDKLLSLDLSSTAISNDALRRGIGAPDLRQLSLNQCARLEDSSLYQLAARHPRLERLELRSGLLSDTGLVSSLSCLPRLVYLDLSSCGRITSAGRKQ